MRDVLAGRRLLAEDGVSVVTKCFRREAQSVPAVRRFVRAVLEDWELSGLADTAEMVTSELASNAVLHARHAAFRVTLRRLGDEQVQVAVIDRSRTLPQQVDPGDDEDHGRGLAIVEALSQKWGAEPMWWGTAKGKKVWADLAAPRPVELPVSDPLYPSHRVQAVYVLVVVAVAALVVVAVAALVVLGVAAGADAPPLTP
ncbi:ATP-binding protein [Streptomyces sp. WG7]|uniref:ATP-binding protein n=1 Tax=Streptomyces sp. WG7 TaxID=3417650 RepID=UPI003CED6B93